MPEALHNGDSVYQTLFESAGDAIFVHNENKILAVNRKACEMLGYTEDELLSISPSEMDAVNHRMYMPARMAKLKKHRFISFETTHQKKDGTPVPVEITAQAITWKGESAVMSICRDNTAKKHYDDILLNAAFEWQRTFDAIKDAVFLLSPEHRILRCNKASYKIFNKSKPGEILGKFCWEVVHGTSEQARTCPFMAAKKTRKRKTSVFKSGGRWLEITVDPVLDGGDNISGVVHVVSDITERKRVEEALRMHQIELEMQNEELRRAHTELETARVRYFDLYELAPVGYCTVSENGLILEANLSAATLLGEDRSALIKQPIFHFILKEDRNIYHQHCKKLFESAGLQAFELRMSKKDGTAFWVHLEASAAQDPDGATVLRVVLGDITGRKRLESEKAELEKQNRQLQKSESLNRMAGAIAHRFNNQLQVVMGYLEMVIGDLPPGDSRVLKLISAMQAAGKASEVSGLLLAYLGQVQVKLDSLDLSELCRMSLPLLQAGKPEAAALETDLPSPGPCISADAKRIQQMLTNLVINAWEAIGDGAGTVHLRVGTVSPADIPVSHRFPVEWRPGEQTYVCLEVADSGCGIQEKDMDNIFDPFFSTKFTGRGLGLAVVLGIVKAHGSVITAESRINGGSAFKVFFPLSVQTASRRDEQVFQAQELVPGGTVLFVEDEEGIRRMAESLVI